MSKARKLRELFEKDGLIRIVGAHNGITAKLVENAGFEGVWASGFEIATSHALPDADILTMGDYLAAAADMNDATSIPIIADCDTGFGNSNNVIQMVKKYESAGIAAVCIEDKLFPKVNSYVSGRQDLAPIAEFVGKIMAGKSVQKDKDFMLFARVEALIAGWGQAEALKRAKAYADAGADAILIHSKKETPEEIMEFLKAWNNYKPVIIVPTSYPNFKESEMKKLGVKMVIYANQGMRAAIKSAQNVLSYISQHGISGIDMNIVPMQEMFDLQGMTKMKEDEKKFLKSEKGDVKAIILAAGDISNEESFKDKDLLKDIPIAMLDINGKPVLQRAVENLNNIGLQNISVATGYKSDKVILDGIEKIENPDYQNSGIADSIFKATEKSLGERNLMIYGDIVFDKEIVERLFRNSSDIVLLIDSSYQENKFPKKDLDLIKAKYPPIKSEERNMRSVVLRGSNPILKIGKLIPRSEANYEFAGMALISRAGMGILKNAHEKLKQDNPDRHFGFIDIVQQAINSGFEIQGVETDGGWAEIKNFEDYKRVCRLLAEPYDKLPGLGSHIQIE